MSCGMRLKNNLKRNPKNNLKKRFLMTSCGIMAMAGFSACAPEINDIDVPYQQVVPKPLSGHVIDGNSRVASGEQVAYRAAGDYWPDYVMTVGISPTTDSTFNASTANYIGSIPVMSGHGHQSEPFSGNDGISGYISTLLVKDAITGYHHVHLEMDIRKGGDVQRIRQDIPLTTENQKLGGDVGLQKTIALEFKTYSVSVNISVGPGLVSRSEYLQGSDNSQQVQADGSWGTPMPFEKTGGSLSDVATGIGSSGYKDFSFHDPIRENTGGFGKNNSR